jgi:hypothetical protein
MIFPTLPHSLGTMCDPLGKSWPNLRFQAENEDCENPADKKEDLGLFALSSSKRGQKGRKQALPICS